MKKTYIYEVITFAETVSRRSFDYFGLACDSAILEYEGDDPVSVFILRRPTSVMSVDYCPRVWRVVGFANVDIERASVLDLLAYLMKYATV